MISSYARSKCSRSPSFDVGKLMDMHGEGVGAKVERGYEPPVQQSV